MIQLTMYRQGNRLIPVSQMDEQDMAKLKEGKAYDVVCTRPGQYSKMRRFFNGLIRKFSEGTGISETQLKFNVKVAIGWADMVRYGDRAIPQARTTAGDNFPPVFVDEAIEVLLREYGPHIKRKDLIAEIERMTKVQLKEDE